MNIGMFFKSMGIIVLILAIGYGFYYTQVVVPYRASYQEFSEQITNLRLKWDDIIETCKTDPGLQIQAHSARVTSLLADADKIANTIISEGTYGRHIMTPKVAQGFGEFLKWHWQTESQIQSGKSCPISITKPNSENKLDEWQRHRQVV